MVNGVQAMGAPGNGSASRVWKGELMKAIAALHILTVSLAMALFTSGCSDDSNSSSPPIETARHVALSPGADRLRVATTTSLYDTGLWSYIEPMFEQEYGVELDVLYAGTGKALEWGRRGDVDLITVHSRAREEQFVEEGFGILRIPFAYNHFVIAGPPSDPADIRGMCPEDAFAVLFTEADAAFVSRGDDSGTHGREKTIWTSAGYDYDSVRSSGNWYVEAGSGMGPVLIMASEMQAYTLSDIGTFLAYRGDLSLEVMTDEVEVLQNVYSVIVVSSTGNINMAENLSDFLVSENVQELIGAYGVEEYGTQLFTPCAGEDL